MVSFSDIDYFVDGNREHDFNKKVNPTINEFIQRGWLPIGGITSIRDGYITQALIRYSKSCSCSIPVS